LDVYQRTVQDGRQFDVKAGGDYHLVYVIEAPKAGVITFNGKSHAAEEGAGVLLAPGESARFEASGAKLELLHMVTPKPPAAVEGGLPGGPGYFFNRKTLRPLSDASGGRVRRFCAESTVRLLDGERLTPTNAIQAGEMHYHAGGSSPYHRHVGTAANPGGASHAYIIFKGRGVVQVGDTSQEIEPGTLVYFPPGIPHRLRAHGGPLDYFELQAWRSFKTDVLSEEPLGLKWYYDPVTPGAARVEWDQS
jgi:mannose-6-phosphate isomerase-like protein (cupin superfamily)